jgi:hypothetical protein
MRALTERRALNRSSGDAGQMRASDGLGLRGGRNQRYGQKAERGAGKKTKRLASSRSSTH